MRRKVNDLNNCMPSFLVQIASTSDITCDIQRARWSSGIDSWA